MEKYFDVVGPFDISRIENLFTSRQRDLWKSADKISNGISNAIGCYMFCIKYGSNMTPWYVGKTVNKAGFQAEVFTTHKIQIYNEVMNGTKKNPIRRRGSPILFLFPLWTDSERFSKAGATKAGTILWLERTLMGMAYARNPALSNIRDMTTLRTIRVPGLLGPRNPGRPHAAVNEVRRALLGRSA